MKTKAGSGMSTISSIRTHLRFIGKDDLFATRDVLHCGSRHCVDQALHIMVKNGELVRWANGVFSHPFASPPRPEEVARIKATTRGDSLTPWPAVPTGDGWERVGKGETFGTTGSTSSFKFGSLRIRFKHTRMRKLASNQGAPPTAGRDCLADGSTVQSGLPKRA